MSKHLINITEAAEQDLIEIIDYISNDNPAAALQVAENIEQRILQLEDFPLMRPDTEKSKISPSRISTFNSRFLLGFLCFAR